MRAQRGNIANYRYYRNIPRSLHHEKTEEHRNRTEKPFISVCTGGSFLSYSIFKMKSNDISIKAIIRETTMMLLRYCAAIILLFILFAGEACAGIAYLSFTARPQGDSVVIEWKTWMEFDNTGSISIVQKKKRATI